MIVAQVNYIILRMRDEGKSGGVIRISLIKNSPKKNGQSKKPTQRIKTCLIRIFKDCYKENESRLRQEDNKQKHSHIVH